MSLAALELSDPRVMHLLHALPLAIAAVDGRGDVVLINERAVRMSGYTIADVPTLDDWRRRAFPDSDYRRRITTDWDRSVAEAARTGKSIEPRDVDITTAAGTVRYVSIMGVPLTGGFLAVFVDHTERQLYESKLREADKLKAVSTLASGIAHEFNNVLGVMLIQLQLASAADDAPPTWAERILGVETVMKQGRRLIGELLDYARRPAATHQDFALGGVLEDVVAMLRPSAPKGVELQLEIAPDMPPMSGIRSQIMQLVLNLGINAFDAMQGREGCVSFIADVERGTGGGGSCLLRVEDQGHGMTAEVQRRLFEPFYSTKPRGQGTGLGMAVVLGILQAHDARIRVESEPDVGTLVEVSFPPSMGMRREG